MNDTTTSTTDQHSYTVDTGQQAASTGEKGPDGEKASGCPLCGGDQTDRLDDDRWYCFECERAWHGGTTGKLFTDGGRDPAELRDEIRAYLRERLENGNKFVKSTHIVNELNISKQRAGSNLKELEDAGDLEVYKSCKSGGHVWSIQESVRAIADGGRDLPDHLSVFISPAGEYLSCDKCGVTADEKDKIAHYESCPHSGGGK